MKKAVTFAGLLLIGLLSQAKAEETRLAVKHDHLWKSCQGVLIFDDQGVRYETKELKHARNWKYEDIQQLGIEPKKVVVLTYQDRKLYLGKDERFTFVVTEGQVDDSLRALLESRLTRPLVSSVLPEETGVKYRIPVRHRKTVTGTQGLLEFSDHYVIYRTPDQRDSRIWKYEDLVSVGTTGPYQLRITATERTGGEFGGGRNFVFDLKEKLPAGAYDFLWNKINRPKIDGVSSEPERASVGRSIDTAGRR
ncbi:MAG: hypothetical protein EHM23_22755 [Acidobacteria bacterium]|nr:MAG: hypothetical protein EHM23_22755 [Acidobacteriota bacterium]